ncbi:dipeptide ABC transporter ATP-binding protein [Streptomyces boninensis]|uniref:dipeptide ABC transporter ATP-binding protein n=1 Tax=Streptomyces boninensis TaxID=2039455 RepID=UPI003B215EF0
MTSSTVASDLSSGLSLVEVADLTVDFPVTGSDPVRAVDGVSFGLAPGGALGIVGESGSGKSTVAAALLGLHRGTGARVSGTVTVGGTDVGAASEGELRALRGGVVAMVFQDPLSALDPYYAIGDQIAEVYRVHRRDASRRAARARAVEVLDRVGIPSAARRARSRPHEFSGGMRQRALIAMALACEPRLLVADEPTTALDVTVQAQILDLLHELRVAEGLGLVLVTHDLGVVAGSVDEVLVMHGGRVVERGGTGEVLVAPTEPYTRSLLAAVPRLEPLPTHPPAEVAEGGGAGRAAGAQGLPAHPPAELAEGGVAGLAAGAQQGFPARPTVEIAEVDGVSGAGEAPGQPPAAASSAGGWVGAAPGAERRKGPLLEASRLRREFGARRNRTVAVDGVSLRAHDGEAIGIVGESGSGKTTLGRMLVGLLEPTAGTLRYDGRPATAISPQRQMVFQDPVSSLNPRRSIGESIADPLRAAGDGTDAQIRGRVRDLLGRVGLDPAAYDRYPHEFSGGQRQRVGIARALAPEPRVLVCDEPVSALDVTTQAQVIDLLADLRRELGLALLFIAHDLAVVRQVSDRVLVMREGAIVEEGPVEAVYDDPQHPYTQALLAAVPVLDPSRAAERRAARRDLVPSAQTTKENSGLRVA